MGTLDELFQSLFPPETPVPRPDPRSWADRLPRVQESQTPPLGRDVIPPEVLLYALGIDPNVKGGRTYNPQDITNYNVAKDAYGHKWQKGI